MAQEARTAKASYRGRACRWCVRVREAPSGVRVHERAGLGAGRSEAIGSAGGDSGLADVTALSVTCAGGEFTVQC